MSSAAVSSCSAEEDPPSALGAPGRERERAEESAAAVEEVDRQLSGASLCRAEEEASEGDDDDDEEEEEEGKAAEAIEVGPRVSIKEQLEKDKDDESLRRWKEQLLGSVDLNSVGETLEPDVKITSLSILSPGRPDIVLPLPAEPGIGDKDPWFTLKEGSTYRLKFTFSVRDNIVSGLRYTNTVWKTGIKVDSTKEMLGTFSPQAEPYTYLTPEETTPSGIFARGSYSARTKFLDDDRKCHLEINYTFDIRREWPSS
ncbi:hypothetical protein ACP70R_042777 [Stipagrostis hirtigluma subsp. patula]